MLGDTPLRGAHLKRFYFLLVFSILWFLSGVIVMRPLSRSLVSKRHSARKFRSQSMRTKAPNMRNAPMRGGWRL